MKRKNKTGPVKSAVRYKKHKFYEGEIDGGRAGLIWSSAPYAEKNNIAIVHFPKVGFAPTVKVTATAKEIKKLAAAVAKYPVGYKHEIGGLQFYILPSRAK